MSEFIENIAVRFKNMIKEGSNEKSEMVSGRDVSLQLDNTSRKHYFQKSPYVSFCREKNTK